MSLSSMVVFHHSKIMLGKILTVYLVCFFMRPINQSIIEEV